ncbi:MAG: hypothetical protein KDK65_06665, partial [Chlamydiia bacterium]|nr:hypothetical protein [Chlamydiia bacterium]
MPITAIKGIEGKDFTNKWFTVDKKGDVTLQEKPKGVFQSVIRWFFYWTGFDGRKKLAAKIVEIGNKLDDKERKDLKQLKTIYALFQIAHRMKLTIKLKNDHTQEIFDSFKSGNLLQKQLDTTLALQNAQGPLLFRNDKAFNPITHILSNDFSSADLKALGCVASDQQPLFTHTINGKGYGFFNAEAAILVHLFAHQTDFEAKWIPLFQQAKTGEEARDLHQKHKTYAKPLREIKPFIKPVLEEKFSHPMLKEFLLATG